MIPRKLVENVFSRFWLLLIPVIAAPAIVFALIKNTPQYTSVATVWVSKPANNIDPGSFARSTGVFQNPADGQVQVFKDLLSTKSFRVDVASAAGISDPAAERTIAKDITVTAAGPNLVAIEGTAATAGVAHALAAAMISQYQARAAGASSRDASIAIDYYNNQLNIAQKDLDQRLADANAYLKDHPAVADAKTIDLNYQQLLGAVDLQTRIRDGLLSSLQDAQRAAASAPQGLESSFSVQDSPSMPASAVHVSLTKRIGYPLAALLLGVLISASFVYLRYRLDHSIRSAEDLQDLAVPLLGIVPNLRPSPSRLSRALTLGWLARRDRPGLARSIAASIAREPMGEGAAQ